MRLRVNKQKVSSLTYFCAAANSWSRNTFPTTLQNWLCHSQNCASAKLPASKHICFLGNRPGRFHNEPNLGWCSRRSSPRSIGGTRLGNTKTVQLSIRECSSRFVLDKCASESCLVHVHNVRRPFSKNLPTVICHTSPNGTLRTAQVKKFSFAKLLHFDFSNLTFLGSENLIRRYFSWSFW